MAGKGSKRRPTDNAKFSEGYDRIWKNPHKVGYSKSGGQHVDKTKYDRKTGFGAPSE